MLWCRSVVERVIDVESSFQSGSFKVRAGVDTQLDEKRRLHNSLPLLLDSISRHQLSPEPVFLNVYGDQESIPRSEFRQPM
jgi:hypothetical protein